MSVVIFDRNRSSAGGPNGISMDRIRVELEFLPASC